jgi:hypothetical protein
LPEAVLLPVVRLVLIYLQRVANEGERLIAVLLRAGKVVEKEAVVLVDLCR